MLTAQEKNLDTWSSGAKRARHDYDTSDHLISEMMHEYYWSTVCHRLQPGDYIYVTDAANERIIFLVDEVDRVNRRVYLSIDERRVSLPITDHTGLTVRWRGQRGGLFCIVNRENKIVASGFKTRRDAEVRLANMLDPATPTYEPVHAAQ